MLRLGMVMAGLGVAAMLTACGGSDGGEMSSDDFTKQSGKKIVAAAKAEMADLKALKFAGKIATNGQEINLDIQTNTDGDCTGFIGIGGGTAELLGVGGETWFKPDVAFWQASAGDQADKIIAAVGDKWVVVGEDDEGFSEFCDADDFLGSLIDDDEDDDDGTTYTKGEVTDVDGADAIQVDTTDEDDATSTGYVLVDAPNYLVKIEKTAGDDTGEVTFSEFNEKFDVEAPADADTIDPATLNAG